MPLNWHLADLFLDATLQRAYTARYPECLGQSFATTAVHCWRRISDMYG